MYSAIALEHWDSASAIAIVSQASERNKCLCIHNRFKKIHQIQICGNENYKVMFYAVLINICAKECFNIRKLTKPEIAPF